MRPAMRVLETACGTGVLTERLLQRLRDDAVLVEADFNKATITHSRTQVRDQRQLQSQITARG